MVPPIPNLGRWPRRILWLTALKAAERSRDKNNHLCSPSIPVPSIVIHESDQCSFCPAPRPESRLPICLVNLCPSLGPFHSLPQDKKGWRLGWELFIPTESYQTSWWMGGSASLSGVLKCPFPLKAFSLAWINFYPLLGHWGKVQWTSGRDQQRSERILSSSLRSTIISVFLSGANHYTWIIFRFIILKNIFSLSYILFLKSRIMWGSHGPF